MAERFAAGFDSRWPFGAGAEADFLEATHRDLRADSPQPIPLVGITRVAFIGRAERGPLNEPVALSSFDDFRRVFGNVCAFSFLPLAVQHFFLHGGQSAIVVRVANRAQRSLIEVPAGGEVLRLQARQPGAKEYLRVSIDYDRVEHDPRRFNLVVQRVSRPGSQLIEDQEFFQGLSTDPSDERFVATALAESELVRLSGPVPLARPDATRAQRPGDPIPYLDMTCAGTDGEELTDYDVIGSDKERTGLFALDGEPFDLLCIPSPPGRDFGTTTFVAAERYCERRRALLVWDPPWSWYSVDAALLGVRHNGLSSRNALTYFPRVRPRGDVVRYPSGMPACGAVAGILARSDRSGPWRTPAIADTMLRANLSPVLELTAKQAAMLRTLGVNTFVRADAGNFALYGNTSCVGPAAPSRSWLDLDRRRLVLFVLNSIERHTQWARHAPRDADVAAELERQIWIFLSRLDQQGAFEPRGGDAGFAVQVRAPAGADDAALEVRLELVPRGENEPLAFELVYREAGIDVHSVAAEAARRAYAGPR